MAHEYATIGSIAQGIVIEGPDGQPVKGVHLGRFQRRNIARLLYRQRRPPKIDPVANGYFLASVAQKKAMLQELVERRAALEVEMEASYMEAAKV